MTTATVRTILAAGIVSAFASLGGARAGIAAPCRPNETAVVVEARAHRLHLCARGEVERTFVVALGTGGIGKVRTGDGKTPLGEYPLGPPRPSSSYHVFIPVAYPTPIQARMGFTGSAIGIHGPPRGWSGVLSSVRSFIPDWTAGCIALGSDSEIEDVSAWLRRQNEKRVRVGL